MGAGGSGSDGNMRIVSPGAGRGPLSRFLMGLALVLVLLLVAGVFVARTERARVAAQTWLGRWSGCDVTVGALRIGLPYELVLEHLSTQNFEQGMPGFKADAIRIGPALRAPFRIRVHQGTLRLLRGASGQWEPAGFRFLGTLPEERIDAISRMAAGCRDWLILEVRGCGIQWSEGGNRLASAASSVDFDMAPVRLPGRRAGYFRLATGEFQLPDGVGGANVEREWLALAGQDYIELGRREGDSVEPVPAFWEYNP